MSKENGIGGWDIRSAADLRDVQLPSNAGKSREIEDLGPNDIEAQHKAAATLGYQLHGSKCKQCSEATEESGLCATGKALYQKMRELGIVE